MLGDSLRRRRPAPAPARKRPAAPAARPHGRFPWARWLLAAVLVLLASFLVGYLLSTQLLFRAPPTAGTGIPVPDLYALDRHEAEGALVEAGFTVGTVTELASARIPAGQVVAQSPVPGQQLRPGAAVDLAISAGPPQPAVPPVEGLGAAMARELLVESGFEVDLRQVPSPLPAGTVSRTEPGAGTPTPLPAVVTLFVSTGPPRADTAGEGGGEGGGDPAGPPTGPEP